MRLWTVIFAVGALTCRVAAADSEPTLTRQVLSNRLKHFEDLVRTISCEFDHETLETSPEQIERIRSVHGKKGAERAIIRREDARVRSGAIKFWRKGAKQREETTFLDDASKSGGSVIIAFDGQIVRQLNARDKDQLKASLATAEGASWEGSPRDDPMTFLYRFYETPFSQVIADASTFTAAVVHRGPERLHRVSVTGGARLQRSTLEMTFDERLLPRERILKVHFQNGQVAPNHKLSFSDYRSYETDSGETVWFPNRILYIGYNGKLPDGEPLEVRREEFRIRKLEFNVEIPDSLFELEIPKNAKIWDGITGLGWLKEGERPEALFPTEARARRLWTAAVVLAAVLLVTGGVFYGRKRRRAAAAKI